MTTLRVTGETKQKLDNLPDRLSDEFEDAAPNDVREEVREVTDALLDEAQFDDFVPLLAFRYAREHLLDDGHEPSRADDTLENRDKRANHRVGRVPRDG